jgi:exopolysaccharide biosynthesis polyprenyl glycosylphosphotransferase
MARYREDPITLLKVADLAIVALALGMSVGLALHADVANWPRILEQRVSIGNALFVAGYLFFWHIMLRAVGLYRSYRLAPAAREVGRIGVAVSLGGALIYPAGRALSFEYATPTFLVAFMALAFVGLTVERRGARMLGRVLRMRGINLRKAVIVGGRPAADEFARELTERGGLGYRVVEILEIDDDASKMHGIKEHLDTLAQRGGLDEVFVVLPLANSGKESEVRELIRFCEEVGIMVRVLAQIANLTFARMVVDDVAGHPVLSIFSGPGDSFQLSVKRALDIALAAAGILVTAPVLLLVAILIRLDSKGPVIFVQERIGQNRRRFHTYKFRTMTENADAEQVQLEHLNEARGPVFKIREDPRVTNVGRWLRRSSLDELPQLWNVLKGDMSLVGPRPLPVRDVERMDVRWHKRRFAVKPGITCLWQANSREPDFDEWIKSDMEYIDQWSLKLDIQILLRTIPAVISGSGAH